MDTFGCMRNVVPRNRPSVSGMVSRRRECARARKPQLHRDDCPSTDARAAADRRLAADGAHRQRARQQVGRHDLGRERARGGVPERCSRAGEGGEHDELPELLRAGDRDEQQQPDDDGLGDVGDEHQPPPAAGGRRAGRPAGRAAAPARTRRARSGRGRRGCGGSPNTCQPTATATIWLANPEHTIDVQKRRKSLCRNAGGSSNTAHTLPSQPVLRSRLSNRIAAAGLLVARQPGGTKRTFPGRTIVSPPPSWSRHS